MKPVRCGRADASGARPPDTDSAERCGRVLPAAGLAHFFAERCGWGKQGLVGMNDWSVLKRMNGKGFMCAVVKPGAAKRNRAATTWIGREGKDIDPGSEMSEMERNERINDSSCVGLALRCE